ncbi:mitochondrial carrier domain-containing protein [Aspergillus pseudonomiae]|uniref:Mitochondrial carrier domain-containing protein n=1 Tax=Aspergillus pseudonomiae TaxID=1506151 RepID=A0A5N7DI90_9EURO|nr:mitochondrial carrier domain-containing protein [Aspergillus pseudonomiae]KAE8406161.1 mitochondrial carrier domain-containing protein [Aspergillus pseudonomiae]
MDNSSLDIWVAGAIAAVTVDFLVYPMDTLKTRIQSPNYNHLYKDATGAIKRDVLFRGLYQGVWSVVLATVPSSGAFFTTYETTKRMLTHSSTQYQYQSHQSKNQPPNPLPITHPLPTPLIHALSSSLGEMVSCAILTPAEVLKQNAQVLNMNSPTTTAAATQSATIHVLAKFRHRPWRLWSGYTALVGRNLPFTGLHFPVFEGVRAWLVDYWRGGKNGGVVNEGGNEVGVLERAVLTGVAAGVAGTVASVVTTPIDVVKTRVMLGASQEEVKGSEKTVGKVKGTLAVGREVWREEGVRGLFRGGALRSVWSAFGMSIYLGIYEGGRMYLEKRRKETDEGEVL